MSLSIKKPQWFAITLAITLRIELRSLPKSKEEFWINFKVPCCPTDCDTTIFKKAREQDILKFKDNTT